MGEGLSQSQNPSPQPPPRSGEGGQSPSSSPLRFGEGPGEGLLWANVSTLLTTANIIGDFTLAPLPGGGNNRVYRVESAGGPLLLKAYFHHPDDPRDRLATEFGFSQRVAHTGRVPRPLASDPANHLGLYEFVAGRKLAAAEVSDNAVSQVIDFFRTIQNPAAFADFQDASEACFSVSAHLATVDRRIARLAGVAGEFADAIRFVRDELTPEWERVRAAIPTPDTPLSPSNRCVSPSDFGFHNALLEADGKLRFLDFEYAGWDDPAKTVCDFFHQPAVPVPRTYLNSWLDAVSELVPDAAAFRQRVAWLMPVYRVKWCCIMLNEFLPAGENRRAFAKGGDADARRREQLDKARAALSAQDL